jgi:hypothetical protein
LLVLYTRVRALVFWFRAGEHLESVGLQKGLRVQPGGIVRRRRGGRMSMSVSEIEFGLVF